MFSKIEKYLKNTKKIKKIQKSSYLVWLSRSDPQTSDIRGSSSIDLLKILKENNYKKVSLHDPIVNQSLEFGYKFMGLNQGFKNADIAIFMTNHHFYKDLKILGLISKMSKPCMIFDCWQIFDAAKIQNFSNITYTSIGLGLK